ncbi:hypothetical protein LZ198_35710 [Myxococcus sp. K15C18031901]|uniref:hypothetical protein n=1 Tax=Myxococcus dinghuensis TaxID=2906761 RepID=UPI0020A7F6FB|nr:hypothetical protein [Myxococcus dinghuensis]MCP3104224.1 hypothetical protein [Myxococcus dinghuensis]
MKALKTSHLDVKVKRALAHEIRNQCLGGTGYDQAMAQSILKKLGYDELPPRESTQEE